MALFLYLLALVLGILITYATIRLAIQHAVRSILDAEVRKVEQLEAATRHAEQVRRREADQPW